MFYSSPLFSISDSIISSIQLKFPRSSFVYKFLYFFSFLGRKELISCLYFITSFFISLNKTFVLALFLFYISFLSSIMKITYLAKRPNWINSKLILEESIFECGYGNPSDFSMSCTCLYLSYWYILFSENRFTSNNKLGNDNNKKFKNTNNNKSSNSNSSSNNNRDKSNYNNGFLCVFIEKNYLIIKYIVLTLFIIILLILIFSRLYFGLSSLDQIFYGVLLGLGLFLSLPLLKLHQSKENKFLRQYYYYKFFITLFLLLNILIFFLCYIYRKDIITNDYFMYEKICEKKFWYEKLKDDCIIGGTSVFAVLGQFSGMFYLHLMIEKNYESKEDLVLFWEKGKIKGRLIRMVLIILPIIPLVGLLIFCKKYEFGFEIVVFAFPAVFFLQGFLSFGPLMYFGFNKVINKYGVDEIYTMNLTEGLTNIERSTIVDYSNEIFI